MMTVVTTTRLRPDGDREWNAAIATEAGWSGSAEPFRRARPAVVRGRQPWWRDDLLGIHRTGSAMRTRAGSRP
jgi:hypothetical protein